ncbi:MAG TPA: hypothetical protein VFB79_06140 [Candidatus Angelobacter sp.]|nr:hypothetical protein [Candidatus Angelobacter sp.]
MYTPPEHTAHVKEHHDGAIEIRAALLVHGDDGEGKDIPKAIQVHILDVDAVLEKLVSTKGLEQLGAGLQKLFGLVHVAADQFEDAHKIEITPETVTGLLEEPPAPAKKGSTRKPAAKTPKPAKKKAAAHKKSLSKEEIVNLLPKTEGSTPPEFPPK